MSKDFQKKPIKKAKLEKATGGKNVMGVGLTTASGPSFEKELGVDKGFKG